MIKLGAATIFTRHRKIRFIEINHKFLYVNIFFYGNHISLHTQIKC